MSNFEQTATAKKRRRVLGHRAGERARATVMFAGGFSLPMRYPMSAFERLLVPGFTELPVCRCGKDMHTASINLLLERTDTHIRIYNCSACHHEMRLTVWVLTQ